MYAFLKHALNGVFPPAAEPHSAPAERPSPALPAPAVRPSTTVFSSDLASWNQHLRRPPAQRVDGEFGWELHLDPAHCTLRFQALNARSVHWAERFNRSFGRLAGRLSKFPAAERVYHRMVFASAHGSPISVPLLSSPTLPSPCAQEVLFDGNGRRSSTRLLVRTGLLLELEQPAHSAEPGTMEEVGTLWEVMQFLILQLAHQDIPRDRFIERIEITSLWVVVILHALYDGKKDGRLDPNRAGRAFEKFIAHREGLKPRELHDAKRLFRLLEDTAFVFSRDPDGGTREALKITVRDFLDPRYLRLSLAEIMPEEPTWLREPVIDWKSKRKISLPAPRAGAAGLLDDEDVQAWKTVVRPLEDCGYLITRQLRMGQFGRVYEAINVANPTHPARVAIKVDRFRKGHKKEAIEAADVIMQIARGVSASPHVIRVFDAGNLRKVRSTYHVLQYVDGDTLDHLTGIAGTEHASILRPSSGRTSEHATRSEYMKALADRSGESWRMARKTPLFAHRPTLAHLLDLLTSKALWIEEVHGLGYAVNDLKNGNVMIGRRGQFKGIDLDSYGIAHSAIDRQTDFFFLGVSTFQLVARCSDWSCNPSADIVHSAMGTQQAIRETLESLWHFEDAAITSQGRVDNEEVLCLLAGFVETARSGFFANEPAAFSHFIDRIISVKRRLSTEEIILE